MVNERLTCGPLLDFGRPEYGYYQSKVKPFPTYTLVEIGNPWLVFD